MPRGRMRLSVFFEAGQDVGPQVRSRLQRIEQSETKIAQIAFLSKKDHVPFQIADMMAYEILKSSMEGRRKILDDLLQRAVGAIYTPTEQELRNAFQNYALEHPTVLQS